MDINKWDVDKSNETVFSSSAVLILNVVNKCRPRIDIFRMFAIIHSEGGGGGGGVISRKYHTEENMSHQK